MENRLPAIYRDYWSEERDKTLAEHAEEWWEEKGRKVPKRGTKTWEVMYQKWVDFAFEGWGER